MKIVFLVVGKSSEKFIIDGVAEFEKRIKRFIPFEIVTIPEIKGIKSADSQKNMEGELILKQIKSDDSLILLDDKGANFSSIEFAKYIEKKIGLSCKRIVFAIGGAYGFSTPVYDRCNEKVSLSKMTFSHQLVRVVFTEQLYRAFTIINNLPYHHE